MAENDHQTRMPLVQPGGSEHGINTLRLLLDGEPLHETGGGIPRSRIIPHEGELGLRLRQEGAVEALDETTVGQRCEHAQREREEAEEAQAGRAAPAAHQSA